MSILEHRQPSSDEDRAPALWLPNRRTAQVRTYRGKSLEALLPKIRSDLGAEAVILREREGLMGGVGGFFATRFVEVEARAGVSIDVYDEDDDADGLTIADLPELPAADRVPALAAPSDFSAQLQEAVQAWSSEAEPEPAPAPEPATAPEAEPASTAEAERRTELSADVPTLELIEPAGPPMGAVLCAISKPPSRVRAKLPRRPAPPRPVDTEAAARVLSELLELGVSDGFARELLGVAAAHGCAVAGGLRAAVRAELTRRLTAAPSLPSHGGAVALVGTGGSGKSLAAAALAATYRYGSSLPVSVASLCEGSDQRRLADLLSPDEVPVTRVPEPTARNGAAVRGRIAAQRRNGLVIIDTPGVSPADAEGLDAISRRLDELAPDVVYIVLSATLGAIPARRALSGLTPFAPSGIVISHADETDQVGVLIELAATAELAVPYLTAGADHRRALIGTDPAALAQLLLP